MQDVVYLLCLDTEASLTFLLTLHTRLRIRSSRVERFDRARPSTPGTPSTLYSSETGSLTTEIRSLGRFTTINHDEELIRMFSRKVLWIKGEDNSKAILNFMMKIVGWDYWCKFSSSVQNNQSKHCDRSRNHFYNLELYLIIPCNFEVYCM